MQTIKQLQGTITAVRNLSPTAREYTITPQEPLPFVAGAFVNMFLEHEGTTIRRAFSMSSSDQVSDSFTLSIRLTPDGALTPLLWNNDYISQNVRLMGPLGLNTADTMKSDRIFLFGFGIGAGVVKSLADHIASRKGTTSLTIVTGNRSTEEILHKDFFDTLAQRHDNVQVTYIVSDKTQTHYPAGYIHEHLDAHDFTNADVYMCGQGVACTALETAIKNTRPQNCNFFIEDFH